LTAVDDVDDVTLGDAPNDVACHRSVGNPNLLGAILFGDLRSSAATIGHPAR
jgi:hypothetical protein